MAAVERHQNPVQDPAVSQAHESRIAVLEAEWRSSDARFDRLEARPDGILEPWTGKPGGLRTATLRHPRLPWGGTTTERE